MLALQPWLGPERISAGLTRVQDAVSSESLSAVYYGVMAGETWPDGHRHDVAHEVDMSVHLVMASGGILSFSWEMQGLDEGLGISWAPSTEADWKRLGDTVCVTEEREWQRLLGSSIESISPAWHVPNEGCPEMPWSFRLDWSSKAKLAVALGESDGAGLTYMPDSITVIFDEALASQYRIPASRTSSLGC